MSSFVEFFWSNFSRVFARILSLKLLYAYGCVDTDFNLFFVCLNSSNKGGQGDILCEMRFHVPNNELDIYREQREAKKKEERKKKKEAAKNGGANEENKEGSDEESDEFDYTQEGDEMTAAKLFNAKIHDKANMDEFSGEIVCSIQDLPMLIPRGNYSLDFYSNFARLHGKTRDYKINFKDISQIIMLEKPDGIHMVYVLHLNTPLR